MRNSKLLKKALPFAMLPLAATINAEVQTVTVGFTTLPEITITEAQAMDFGSVLSLTAADSCVMTVSSTQTVTQALERSNIAPAGSAGALTGDCSGDPGTPGVYVITGIQGTEVQVSITGSTNADISFAPAGYVVDFGGAAGTGDDARTDITTAASQTAFTARTDEFSATAQAGVTTLVMGGTVQNQRALLADTAVTADFTVDVIYN